MLCQKNSSTDSEYCIEPVLRYGSESWNVDKQIRKRLDAAEMWFLRQMLYMPRIDGVTNNDCPKKKLNKVEHYN